MSSVTTMKYKLLPLLAANLFLLGGLLFDAWGVLVVFTELALTAGLLFVILLKHFSGQLKQTSMEEIITQPYLRVFIQQFAIIFGGFALILLARFSNQSVIIAFGTVFIAAKLVFEIYYQALVRKADLSSTGLFFTKTEQ